MIEGCKHGPTYAIPQPCAECERERLEEAECLRPIMEKLAALKSDVASDRAVHPEGHGTVREEFKAVDAAVAAVIDRLEQLAFHSTGKMRKHTPKSDWPVVIAADIQRLKDNRARIALALRLAEHDDNFASSDRAVPPEAANQTVTTLMILREQGYLGVDVAEALKIARLASDRAVKEPETEEVQDDDVLTRVHPMDQVTHSPTATRNEVE